tara:strand:+ start:52 stop:426 length:375 start_codon:yes stop_codon:yes gene_type:complete
MFKLAFATTALVVMGLQYNHILYKERPQFVARVTLEETCEMEVKSFSIQNLSTGDIKPFTHGEAFIRASEMDILKVVLNPKYKQVRFDGVEVLADKSLKISQNCVEPTSLDSIFDSFNETFSTD